MIKLEDGSVFVVRARMDRLEDEMVYRLARKGDEMRFERYLFNGPNIYVCFNMSIKTVRKTMSVRMLVEAFCQLVTLGTISPKEGAAKKRR